MSLAPPKAGRCWRWAHGPCRNVLEPSVWTLAHTKGPTSHRSWQVRTWGYPAASKAVDKNSTGRPSVIWGRSANPRGLGSFQCFWATYDFLDSLPHWATKCWPPKLCFCEALSCEPSPTPSQPSSCTARSQSFGPPS